MDFLFTFQDGSKVLAHYGIKGMKWGVHNEDTKQKYGEAGSASSFAGGGGSLNEDDEQYDEKTKKFLDDLDINPDDHGFENSRSGKYAVLETSGYNPSMSYNEAKKQFDKTKAYYDKLGKDPEVQKRWKQDPKIKAEAEKNKSIVIDSERKIVEAFRKREEATSSLRNMGETARGKRAINEFNQKKKEQRFRDTYRRGSDGVYRKRGYASPEASQAYKRGQISIKALRND